MNAKDRKIERENCLVRLQPIDPELAEEVRAMWAEETPAHRRTTDTPVVLAVPSPPRNLGNRPPVT
jgi:hypothetical protein